ncbi:hypothetical protein [Virgibacillus salarius]|uniref:hypothetical protein n=1 Tax=Virgibacillus salarius TaxID=447199 RepID=UPI0031EA03DE
MVEGQQGKDLVLTIDIALQEKVDQIVRDELKAIIKKYPYENRHMEDALAVVLNPKTGELLAVSGQHYDRKQNAFRNTAYKALYDQHILRFCCERGNSISRLSIGCNSSGRYVL